MIVVRTFLGSHDMLAYLANMAPRLPFHAGEVRRWNIITRKEAEALNGALSTVMSIAISPDGKTLAVGSGEFRKSGVVKLWDMASGKEGHILAGHTNVVMSVAFSPDSKTLASAKLASASHDRTIKLWDVDKAVQPKRDE